MVEREHPELPVSEQCRLLSISRSGYYYEPRGESPQNLEIMAAIDQQFLKAPFYGVVQMTHHLRNKGWLVSIKRVRRLMRLMGLMPIYQQPRTTIPDRQNAIYPYLLADLTIDRVDQVWCADITYIPMARSHP